MNASSAVMDPQVGNESFADALNRAHQAQKSADAQSALRLWEQVHRRFPEQAAAFAGYGCMLRQQQREDDAETVLLEGRQRFPEDEAIAREHGWLAHQRGNWLEANARWTALRAQFPHSFGGYYGGGVALRNLRRFDEADAVYRQAIARWPNASNLLSDYAAAAQVRGDYEEASRRWDALREKFPDEADSYLNEARAWRNAGRFERAGLVLSAAARRFPSDEKVLIEVARVAQQQRMPSEALKRWDVVATQFPGLAEGHVGAAHALNDLGRFADAETVLQPALRMFPNSSEIAVLNAWIAHYQKHYKEALSRWLAVRQRFPGLLASYSGATATYLAMGKVAEAAAVVEQALALFPNNIHVAMDYARIPRHTNDWAEAERRWASVHERFAQDSNVTAAYAHSLAKNGKGDEAEQLLQAAIAIDNTDMGLLRAYAECATLRLDLSAAQSRWSEIVERFPEQATGWVGLGEAYRAAGLVNECDAMLLRARQRFPDNMELELLSARTATLRRDWPVAMPQWERLKLKYPRRGEVTDGVMQALRQLFMKFESFGDTCEFGIVQRRFGAEPISLLRWASINPSNLTRALDAQFEGLGDQATTVVSAIHGEYTWCDSHYGVFSHTFTPETAETLEKFTAQHLRRMQFLRRKLVADLAAAEKIVVYKSNQGLTDEQARGIFQAIRRFGGKVALLCVRLKDDAHKAARLEELDDGLFMGYIDRFSTVDINVDVWIDLCRQVESIWAARAESK